MSFTRIRRNLPVAAFDPDAKVESPWEEVLKRPYHLPYHERDQSNWHPLKVAGGVTLINSLRDQFMVSSAAYLENHPEQDPKITLHALNCIQEGMSLVVKHLDEEGYELSCGPFRVQTEGVKLSDWLWRDINT